MRCAIAKEGRMCRPTCWSQMSSTNWSSAANDKHEVLESVWCGNDCKVAEKKLTRVGELPVVIAVYRITPLLLLLLMTMMTMMMTSLIVRVDRFKGFEWCVRRWRRGLYSINVVLILYQRRTTPLVNLTQNLIFNKTALQSKAEYLK